ncbi:DUF6261 family protein [Parabacteroides sp. PF5-9]|uniref:DUF6261 family protein n=1 Tax=Parabacteroides sp. PF5-9 TaxID=1742404 RepID=UPI0024752F39|nr:DUF6261 family protein [Parabacteroides sp. PF5-9]MDH6356915.1 hypothetical protein [Parabacteroides sp. PF5-9]
MEQIKIFKLPSMSNGEYFQFMTNVYNRIKLETPEKLKIVPLFQKFEQILIRLDHAIIVHRKSGLTDKINQANINRTNLFKGLSTVINGLLYNNDEQKKSKAKLVRTLLDNYGNVTIMSLDKKSTYITNMVNDLLEAPYIGYITSLGLGDQLNALSEENRKVITLMQERITDRSNNKKENSRLVRKEMDEVYRQIIDMVNAQALVASVSEGGAEDFLPFIHAMNAQIYRVKKNLAIRAGKLHASKQKGKIASPDHSVEDLDSFEDLDSEDSDLQF